jgi:hypothetical protein
MQSKKSKSKKDKKDKKKKKKKDSKKDKKKKKKKKKDKSKGKDELNLNDQCGKYGRRHFRASHLHGQHRSNCSNARRRQVRLHPRGGEVPQAGRIPLLARRAQADR